MGGSIAIAARFKDGQAICIDGWTNFIPAMIMNETTLSGDDSIVRRDLLKAATIPSYDGPQPFRASGYGIVVIDFVTLEIHSMQGYTNFRNKLAAQLLDQKRSGWTDGTYRNVLSEEAEGLLDAGRVRHVGSNGEPCEPVVLDRNTALAMNDERFLSMMTKGVYLYTEVEIDIAPFTVFDHEENTSLKPMKDRLRATGFPLTVKDGLNAMLKGVRTS
jgi:hypothetical protein